MSGHTAERWSGKEWAVRLVIAHLGVTLFLLSRLGADPFNVFVQGVFVKAGPLLPEGFLTHGRTHIALSLCIIAVLLIVDRSYIKAGTLICMTCGGPIIDFFTWLLTFLLPEDLPFPGRLAMLVLGCLILAYGMTIVITSKAGTGPNDLVAVVIADKRKFVSALIVPNYQLIEQYANERGIAYGSREALCKDMNIRKMIMARINTLQQDLANYEKVKHIILLPAPFSIETGELTNTLKVKRNVVNERYAQQIDELYEQAEKNFSK